MSSIAENRSTWENYDWKRRGDEWSDPWGGTDYLWLGTILPRLQAFFPTGVILEIAPGFGRLTQYLIPLCTCLLLVDLSDRCIQACKQRFAAYRHIRYFVNDGMSLAMVPEHSVDFVFSFDSLVHAENDVIETYLGQLARKLKPNGVGFIHHSNIGAFVDPHTGYLPFANAHFRAESMTARRFEEICRSCDLLCINQELVNWIGPNMIDCFSLFTRKGSIFARPNHVLENDWFMDEVTRLSKISQFYHLPGMPGASRNQALKMVLKLSKASDSWLGKVRGFVTSIVCWIFDKRANNPQSSEAQERRSLRK